VSQPAEAPKPPRELQVEKIHEYRATGKVHVLIPEARLAQLNPFFKVSVNQVNISPAPADKDVWALPGGKKYSLSKQGLYKIACAAGISFCGATIVSVSSDYVCVQAKIRKRNTAGEWEYRDGTCEIDLQVVEEDLFMGLVEKLQKFGGTDKYYGPKNEAECREKARVEAMKIRRYKVARAETGAYLRAIKSMLPLKGEYEPQELRMPFIVAASHLSPDFSNPVVKEMMKDSAALNIAYLWGEPADVAKLETSTGKSVQQLQASQDNLRQLTAGEDVDTVTGEVLHAEVFHEEDDAFYGAMRDAPPADVEFEEI
jgi:hypothetical protein